MDYTVEKDYELIKQYRTIQEAGVTNMFDRFAVQFFAQHVQMYALVVLCEDKAEYARFLSQFGAEWYNITPDEDKVREVRECSQSQNR